MFIYRKGHKNTYMKIITRISTPTEKLLLNSLCIAAWAPVTSIWWKGGWENSQHFATLPMVSLDNEVWWHVTSLIWIVLLIERSKFPMLHDQYQKNYSVLGSDMSAVWNLYTVPQISLLGKPAVVLWNAGCFLRVMKSYLWSHLIWVNDVTKLDSNTQ